MLQLVPLQRDGDPREERAEEVPLALRHHRRGGGLHKPPNPVATHSLKPPGFSTLEPMQ
jgi:hypothetical protein